MWHVSMTRFVIMVALIPLIECCVFGQQRGTIAGRVSPPMAGVVVIIANQVTSKVTRARARTDGHYSFRIPAGAYRLSVAAPYTARFDPAKNYGEHALIRDDV